MNPADRNAKAPARKAAQAAGMQRTAREQVLGPELSELVRFHDPASGQTWNGFGRPPNWIRGKDREQFRVR